MPQSFGAKEQRYCPHWKSITRLPHIPELVRKEDSKPLTAKSRRLIPILPLSIPLSAIKTSLTCNHCSRIHSTHFCSDRKTARLHPVCKGTGHAHHTAYSGIRSRCTGMEYSNVHLVDANYSVHILRNVLPESGLIGPYTYI